MSLRERMSPRVIRLGVLLASIGLAAPVLAQNADGLASTVTSTAPGGGPSPIVESDSPLNWWSIPWRARSALRKMATQRRAWITRCRIIERDQFVTYEVHARRRLGLFQSEDIVLTRFTETREEAEARREARSLRGRMKSLGESVLRADWSSP